MRTNANACELSPPSAVMHSSFSLLFSSNNSIIRHRELLDFNRTYTAIVFSCVAVCTLCWHITYIVIISMLCFMNEMKFLIRDNEKTPLKAENAMKWMTRRTRTNIWCVFTETHSVPFQYVLRFCCCVQFQFSFAVTALQSCMWRECDSRKIRERMKTHHKFGNDFPRNGTRLFIATDESMCRSQPKASKIKEK